MVINIKTDVARMERYLTSYQRRVIPKATNRALNTTGRNISTAINRYISKQTGLKVGDVREGTKIYSSNLTKLAITIEGRGRAFNLIRFVSPGKRAPGAFDKQGGVRANAWRKSKIYRGAFIIRGATHGKPIVVKRKSIARGSLQGLYGPSLRIEFDREPARALMSTTARTRFPINFERDLKFYLSRL